MAADAMTTDIRIKALELAIDAVGKGAARGDVEAVARQFEAFLSGPAPIAAFIPGFSVVSEVTTGTTAAPEGWLTPEMAAAARRMGME